MSEDDWRLAREERWMYGARLQRLAYTAPTVDWDHDHCSLCWAKFTAKPLRDTLQDGYVHGHERRALMAPLEERRLSAPDAASGFTAVESPTMEKWICLACFDDFKERFGWRLVE